MTRRMILSIAIALAICVSVSAYAGNGQVPGQPFEYLQQQIDALKQQVAVFGQLARQIAALQQQISQLIQEMALVKQNGVYGYKVMYFYKDVTVEPGAIVDIQFALPVGTKILGGGTMALYPAEELTLVNAFPNPSTCHTADYVVSWDWYVAWYRNDSSQTLTGSLMAWAIYGGEEFKGNWYGCD